MNFGYNWILTVPQIEIMQADLPHTLYLRDKDKKGSKRKVRDDFKYNPNDPAIAKQLEANRKAEERRKAKAEGKIPYTTDELFKK